MIFVLLTLGTLAFALLLLPILAPPKATAQDTRRTELEEERELLLGNLRELQDGGSDAATLTREKVRLTQVLHELDTLPPAPRPGEAKPALPVALMTVLGVALLLGVGSFTLFPQWRNLSLSANEQAQLTGAARLPRLAAQAEKTQATADYLAWGDAAWDAGKFNDAAKAYTQVLLKERDNAKALRRVGYALLGSQEMARDGMGFIARSVELDPQAPEGQLLYGYGLGLFGQYQEGIKALETYQKLDPDGHDADDLLVEYQSKVGVAVDGQLVYSQNCAGCHGQNGEGGTAPKIVGSPALKNEQALRQIILNGAAGMPAFPQLEGKQLDALIKTMQGEKWQ